MKNSRIKKIILSIIICPILLCIVTLAYLFSIQEKRIFDFKPLDSSYVFDYDIPHEVITIKTEDSTVSGILFKAKNPNGAVYYLHGKGSNLSFSKWKSIAKNLVENYNKDVLMIDYRGFGKSTGKITYEGLLNDVQAGYNYLKTIHNEDNITVYGLSLGTSFATYIASKNNPQRLILEAPFYSLYDVACSTLPAVPPFLIKIVIKYPLRTDTWIQNVKCPVAIFHGTKDKIIPCNSSIRLTNLVSSPCDLTIIPHGDHDHLNTTKEYQEKIDSILR